MLADVPARAVLVAIEELDQKFGVTLECTGHEPEARLELWPGARSRCGICQRRAKVTEQPRPPEASPAHHHAVRACLAHHPHRVIGTPDIAIAQHGHARHRGLESLDGRPVRCARVELGRCAGVQSNARNTGSLGDAPRLEVGQVL
jgi:hypothetical protein